jgi:hypothetical protein
MPNGWRRWRWLYALVGSVGIGGYAAGELWGLETGTEARDRAEPGARGGGGYRNWIYWHGGYRRGK